MSSSDIALSVGSFSQPYFVLQESNGPRVALASSNERYHFIDGLRGIAALLVLVFHIWHNAGLSEVAKSFPRWLDATFMTFGNGVDIFFVISGFVIAHSIRNMTVTPARAANFALRRQIRLDPPYWVCTFVALALTFVASRKNPALVHLPSAHAVAANIFYLQGFLGLPNIDPVAWTLCLEVQFYIVFILIVWAAQRFSSRHVAQAALVSLLAIASVGWNYFLKPTPWFIGSWHLFAAGVVCYWTFARKIHPAFMGVLVCLALSLGFRADSHGVGFVIGPATALAVLAVGRSGNLGTWLNSPVFCYLATISYSLYLIHFHIVSIIFRAGMRNSGRSTASGILWALVAAGVSIGLAHLVWLFVERPSKRLSSSLKPRGTIASSLTI
jgi:peptidoglycan/LPS O-acetylase OafA/YrhL